MKITEHIMKTRKKIVFKGLQLFQPQLGNQCYFGCIYMAMSLFPSNVTGREKQNH